MGITVLAPPAPIPPVCPTSEETGGQRRLPTREEYYRAAEAGIFGPEERLELIEGDVIRKASPQGTRHAVSICLVSSALAATFGGSGDVITQLPLSIPASASGASESEPEPDVAVVRGGALDYVDRHPGPQDTLLVVEVADRTVRFDRERKGPLYARAGIPEYWILNLSARVLEIYREPSEETGTYLSAGAYSGAAQVAPLAAPQGTLVKVEDLLPPAS